MAAPTGRVSQSLIRLFCNRIARGPDARMPESARSTAAFNCAAGTTSSTRPQDSAVAASIVSPVSNRRRVRPQPINPRQQRRFDHGGHANADLRHAEPCVAAGDTQIARGRDFQPGAKHLALDAGDRRHRQPAKHVATAMHQRDERSRRGRVQTRHLVDVGTTYERAFVPAPRSTTARSAAPAANRSTAAISAVITVRFSVFSFGAFSIVTHRHATRVLPHAYPVCLLITPILPLPVALPVVPTHTAPVVEPHPEGIATWQSLSHCNRTILVPAILVCEHSPRDTLVDRSLLFAIVVLVIDGRRHFLDRH